jgi:hypothetical protein
MNWKLIFTLSLFGLVMALATVSLIPSKIEPAFWLVIFLICAYFIAKRAPSKYFLHGFLVSIVNSVWITLAHIMNYDTYIANHAEEVKMSAEMHMETSRASMAMMGPLFGIVFGLILGLFSFIASKLVKK